MDITYTVRPSSHPTRSWAVGFERRIKGKLVFLVYDHFADEAAAIAGADDLNSGRMLPLPAALIFGEAPD
jgi:hypothetical protein